MTPKITRYTYQIDDYEKVYYILSHEFYDPGLRTYWSWDILVLGENGAVILAIWDSKNLRWINPDVMVIKGAQELVEYVHSQIC